MRIAFITPEFVTEPYFSGGLANYLHRLSSALAEGGHDVHVIVESKGVDSFAHRGVTVHRVDPSRAPFFVKHASRLLPYPAVHWVRFAFAAQRRLSQLHRESPVDVVQLPNLRACGLAVVAFSRIPHVTRLSSLEAAWRGAAQGRRSVATRVTEGLETLQLRLSRDVIAPSDVLAQAARQRGLKAVAVVRSPAFVEEEDQDATVYRRLLAGREYLLFVGRYDRHKGAHVLGAALPSVLRALPNAEVAFVGSDAQHESGGSMKAFIRQCCSGFDERLHFIAETPHRQLYPIISGAKLVVLPSLVDNLPNSMLEAMTLGRPVLGTIGTSFDEVIKDGHSGFLVPPNDPSALSAAIIAAWTHPDLEAIGARAREAVGAFSPHVTIPAALACYERAIQTQRRTARTASP